MLEIMVMSINESIQATMKGAEYSTKIFGLDIFTHHND
jgi:hypothetical protein